MQTPRTQFENTANYMAAAMQQQQDWLSRCPAWHTTTRSMDKTRGCGVQRRWVCCANTPPCIGTGRVRGSSDGDWTGCRRTRPASSRGAGANSLWPSAAGSAASRALPSPGVAHTFEFSKLTGSGSTHNFSPWFITKLLLFNVLAKMLFQDSNSEIVGELNYFRCYSIFL